MGGIAGRWQRRHVFCGAGVGVMFFTKKRHLEVVFGVESFVFRVNPIVFCGNYLLSLTLAKAFSAGSSQSGSCDTTLDYSLVTWIDLAFKVDCGDINSKGVS